MGRRVQYRAQEMAPRIALVVSSSIAAILAWSGAEPWRVGLGLAAVPVGAVLWFRQGRPFDRGTYGLSVLGQVFVIVATGSLYSPLVPVLLPPLFLAAVLLPDADRRTLFATPLVLLLMTALSLSGHPIGAPSELFMRPAIWGPTFTMVLLGVAAVGVRTFIAVVDDLNAARRRQIESAAERAREIALLTATLGHELKNPLAAIQGLSTLLARGDPEDRRTARAMVIAQEADRMRTRLDALLGLARPLGPLQLAPVDLSATVHDLAAAQAGLASGSEVSITVDAPPSLWTAADASKLRSALVNLVQNAIDAAPAGTTVALSLRSADGLWFSVSDQGPGLDPAVRSVLFAPGATTKPAGNGLGLMIARAIVRQHGGRLSLDDRDGGGTTASVWLPEAAPAGR
jgi:two-component system, NtrC family, sensor histidine kinase HydH